MDFEIRMGVPEMKEHWKFLCKKAEIFGGTDSNNHFKINIKFWFANAGQSYLRFLIIKNIFECGDKFISQNRFRNKFAESRFNKLFRSTGNNISCNGNYRNFI